MAEGEITDILDYRRNPDENSPFIHEYKVVRRNKKKLAQWESMERILNIDSKFPMSKYCSEEHILKYHNKLKKGEVVVEFEIEQILEEKRDENGDFSFRIRWKDWPKEYDTWEHVSNIPEAFVHSFRRQHAAMGANGFDRIYWDSNYSDVWHKYMDGADNGSDHANYCHAFFKKFQLHNSIKNIADFGFGMGGHLEAFTKKFKPRVVYGLEPSEYAFDEFVKAKGPKQKRSPFSNAHFQVECVDILTYCLRELKKTRAVTKKRENRLNASSEEQKRHETETSSSATPEAKLEAKLEAKPEPKPEVGPQAGHVVGMIDSIPEFIQEMTRLHCAQKHGTSSDGDVVMSDPNLKCKGVFHCGRHPSDDAEKLCNCRWDGMFNLGLFVSVGQYLDDETFEAVIKCLSYWCDFLYMDVVTSEEYDIMSKGSTFVDAYAIRRSKKWYLTVISKYWRIVGNALLESRFLYDYPQSSNIPTLLFHYDPFSLQN